MPKYTVQITPELAETVEAESPEQARRIVDQLIQDKGTRKIFDKLYFDYDTGVNVRGIRRKLAQAEVGQNFDDRELVLDRIVGSGNHLKNSRNAIAITPQGMRQLGLEPKKIRLADGTVIEQNTVVDEKGFNLRNDLADFAGIAGPLAGALYFLRDRSSILRYFSQAPRFGRTTAVAFGSGSGKIAEEVGESLRGVQDQSTAEIAREGVKESLLGLLGQGIGEGLGSIYTMYLGKRIPIDEGKMLSQINKGINGADIRALEKDLGRFPTNKEIQQGIADGSIRLTGVRFVPGQKTAGAEIPGRIQAVTETVFGNKRLNDQKDYFLNLFNNLGRELGSYGDDLEKFVSQSTKQTIDESIDVARNNLLNKEKDIMGSIDDLLKTTLDDALEVGNRADLPGKREFGVQLAQALGTARSASQAFIKSKYDAVGKVFDDLIEVPTNATSLEIKKADAIKGVIVREFKNAKQKAEDIYKTYLGKFKDAKNLDPNFQNLKLLYKSFDGLNLNKPNLEFVRDLHSLAREMRVLMKQKTPARKAYTSMVRLLDNFDSQTGNYLEGDSILKNLHLNAANDITLRAGAKFTQKEAAALENAIEALRDANRNTYRLEQAFDQIPEAMIVKDATLGAFDGDEIFEKLVVKGTTTRLQGVMKALKEFDEYKKNIPGGQKYLDDLPYKSAEAELKGKIKQRLFADLIDESTDFSTDTINIQEFGRRLERFDKNNRGKLDILFTDKNGVNTADRIRAMAGQLVQLNPKIKPSALKDVINDFASNSKGLSELDTGTTFLNRFLDLADASAKRLAFTANRGINDLPNKTVEEITESIFRPNAASNIDQLRGLLSPEVFQSVQRTSMQRILENSIDVQGRGSINDILKPGRLKKSLDSYGDETLDAMFGTKMRQELRNIADVMDIATRGEVGRGGGAGTLVAATIAVNAFNINMLPTVIGLGILREVFSNPNIVGLLIKRDKGSIARVLEAFSVALRQQGVRYVNDEIGFIDERVREAIESEDAQNILAPLAEDFATSIQEIDPRPPQASAIELPEISAPSTPVVLDSDRLEFAERLAGRPVI